MPLSTVFENLFSGGGAARKKNCEAGPTSQEAEEQREVRRTWKTMSGQLMSSSLFHAVLRISLVAKGPLSHFLNWGLAARSLQVQRRKDAAETMKSTQTKIRCFRSWLVGRPRVSFGIPIAYLCCTKQHVISHNNLTLNIRLNEHTKQVATTKIKNHFTGDIDVDAPRGCR